MRASWNYFEGYSLLHIILLKKSAYKTKTPAPAETGKNKKLRLSLPISIIIGLAPAGGCTVLVIIIAETANPTDRPIER